MFQKGSIPPPQLTKSFKRLNSPSSSSSLHSDAHPSKIKCSSTNAKVLRLMGWYDSTDGCMVKEYISLVNMCAKVSRLFTDIIVLMVITNTDSTGIHALEDLIKSLKKRDVQVSCIVM
nr:uncharacterized protein LOC104094242 isoform X2 [Nicotiana tomentosiformis]